jgi:hypothetical protein
MNLRRWLFTELFFAQRLVPIPLAFLRAIDYLAFEVDAM